MRKFFIMATIALSPTYAWAQAPGGPPPASAPPTAPPPISPPGGNPEPTGDTAPGRTDSPTADTPAADAPAAPPRAEGATEAEPPTAEPLPPRASPKPATEPATATPPTPTSGPSEPPKPAYTYPPLGGTPEQQAEPGDWDPWDHPEALGGRNHKGFFLRLSLGPGGGSINGKQDASGVDDVAFSGLGMASDIAIGASIVPNLALHLDLFFSWVLDASGEGGPYDDRDYEFDGDVQLQGTGLGLTYHIMPINLYLSAAGGLGSVAWEQSEGTRSSTRLGFATNVLVGKEWWVDPQWGIGLAGQFIFISANDSLYDHVNAMSFNVLFSATYN